MIKREFTRRMAEYNLFGKLHFNHDDEKLDFEIAHMNADGQKDRSFHCLATFLNNYIEIADYVRN